MYYKAKDVKALAEGLTEKSPKNEETEVENRSKNKQEDEINRTAKAGKFFPKFLGQSEEEQKASRVLATAASVGREDSRGNESQKTVQRGQLLLTIETEVKKEGIWIEKPAELVIKKIGEEESQVQALDSSPQ